MNLLRSLNLGCCLCLKKILRSPSPVASLCPGRRRRHKRVAAERGGPRQYSELPGRRGLPLESASWGPCKRAWELVHGRRPGDGMASCQPTRWDRKQERHKRQTQEHQNKSPIGRTPNARPPNTRTPHSKRKNARLRERQKRQHQRKKTKRNTNQTQIHGTKERTC